MKNEIVLYQSDELPEHIEVRLDQDTVWLSLNQIAQLFSRDKSVISRHLNNIYKEGELSKEATVAKNATVQIEAGRKVERRIDFYNFRYQSGISCVNHGKRQYMPNVFTKQGVVMLSAEIQSKLNHHIVKMGLVWS